MSWKLYRRIWVTLSNLIFLLLMGFGFLLSYQTSHLSGGYTPLTTLLDIVVPLLLILLLVLGIVFEWLDWVWPALLINVGFWGFFGLSVLGSVMLALAHGAHDPEAGLTTAIVGIPCTVVAVVDFVFYWKTRQNR